MEKKLIGKHKLPERAKIYLEPYIIRSLLRHVPESAGVGLYSPAVAVVASEKDDSEIAGLYVATKSPVEPDVMYYEVPFIN